MSSSGASAWSISPNRTPGLAVAAAGRVITPVHPGFGGTARPDGLADVPAFAKAYAQLLEELGLTDVTVVGNSLGGWIAAEMALLRSDRISAVVLVNAVGIHVPGHPVADPATLTPAELSTLAFHDPAKFAVDPSTFSEAQRTIAAANQAALQVYSGPHAMADPTLGARLAKVARTQSSSHGARATRSSTPRTERHTPPPFPTPASSCCATPATCPRSRPRRNSSPWYGVSPTPASPTGSRANVLDIHELPQERIVFALSLLAELGLRGQDRLAHMNSEGSTRSWLR
uniref:Alpha/beta fold hydrolase n=1 Tax=Streptomyces sp. NBC_00003 TaxID=2903608 RepID=A0AAU2UYT0_9ACTN